MNKPPLFAVFYLLLLILHTSAEESIQGFNFTQSVAASVNPPGFLLTTHFFYRLPLAKKAGILWESTKFDAGICNDLSPAFENPGLFIRCEPVAFFEITLNANKIQLFKAFGSGYVSLDSSTSPHSASDLKNVSQSNEQGWWLRGTPVFKAAYKNLILANATTVHYFQMNREGFYLERFTNTTLDSKDFVITNDLFFFYKCSSTLMTGINHSYLKVPSSNERVHRISFAAVYLKKFSKSTGFNVALMGGTYLKHLTYNYKDPFVGLQLQYSYGLTKPN